MLVHQRVLIQCQIWLSWPLLLVASAFGMRPAGGSKDGWGSSKDLWGPSWHPLSWVILAGIFPLFLLDISGYHLCHEIAVGSNLSFRHVRLFFERWLKKDEWQMGHLGQRFARNSGEPEPLAGRRYTRRVIHSKSHPENYSYSATRT